MMCSRRLVFLLLVLMPLAGCAGFSLPFVRTAVPTPSTTRPPASLTFPPAPTATRTSTPLPTLPPTPILQLDDPSIALLPEYAADADQFPDATRYWIEVDVAFDPQAAIATMRGITRIQFTNPTENALTDLALMLWPNDPQFEATMTAGPVLLDGRLLDTQTELEGLALRVALPHALSPGKTLDLSIPFWIEAYQLHPFMPQRFGIAQGVLIAPTFYPLIPRLVDGAWQVEAAPLAGDRTNSDTAFYYVEITASAEFALAASGVLVSQEVQAGGSRKEIYVTGPMRDFAFALGNLQIESRQVGEVLLNAYVLPEHTDDIELMLDVAAEQMALLNELIGPYPYTELDLVDAPGAFGGVEYPGLVYIGTLGTSQVIRPTIHEVAHQWFYALIGDDQVYQPWLDEAAASYAEVLYFERTGGVGMATGYLTDVRALLRDYPDPTLPIGMSVGEYPTPSDYAVIVYRKGALFFDALRRDLGDQVFFEFLQVYFDRYRYGFASAEDFQNTAEETCDCDLDTVFDLWVYEGGELPIP